MPRNRLDILETPINRRDLDNEIILLDDDYPVQTHRVLDYDQTTEKVLISKIS